MYASPRCGHVVLASSSRRPHFVLASSSRRHVSSSCRRSRRKPPDARDDHRTDRVERARLALPHHRHHYADRRLHRDGRRSRETRQVRARAAGARAVFGQRVRAGGGRRGGGAAEQSRGRPPRHARATRRRVRLLRHRQYRERQRERPLLAAPARQRAHGGDSEQIRATRLVLHPSWDVARSPAGTRRG